MPPAPKSTVPKHNERDIHPPLHTTVVEIAISGQKSQPVATGTTTSKKSWESVFQLLNAQGTGPSQNLNDSILEMIKNSYFLKAFFSRLFNSRGNGINKKFTDRDQALSTIMAHRAAWDQEILARSISSCGRDNTDCSDEVIAGGAIYAMFRMIPRAEDAVAPAYQLRWHKYYDGLPEVMLWAVLHDFLKFLRSHAVKKTTFGRTLLEICEVEAAKADSVVRGPNEDGDGDEDHTEDDKEDGQGLAGVKADCVTSTAAATLSEEDERDDSRATDSQEAASVLLSAIMLWLVACLGLCFVAFRVLVSIGAYVECGGDWKCWRCRDQGKKWIYGRRDGWHCGL